MEYELSQFQELKTTSCYRGEEFGVSSVVFDPQEDLLWAATFGVGASDHGHYIQRRIFRAPAIRIHTRVLSSQKFCFDDL